MAAMVDVVPYVKNEVLDSNYSELIQVQLSDDHTALKEGEIETLTLQLKEEDESQSRGSLVDESDASMRSRLVESLCMSFPGSALSRALHMMESDESDKDPLSQSCFAQLRLEKTSVLDEDDDDDELTSLAWLQDRDLLKNINPGDRSLCTSPADDDSQKENVDYESSESGYYGQPHPPHVPYNPQKHVNSKPPYSFSCLIFMAIEDSPTKRLPVKEIYNWIVTNFPYFQNAPTGWKNSVRHNLSLNKCFRKVDKERGTSLGKGSLWMIDPDYRPNLLQALRKTPYHPYHQLQMLSSPHQSYSAFTSIQRPGIYTSKQYQSIPSHLFPFLNRRLNQSKFDTDSSDIDVANALVYMKRAAENRRPLRSYNGHRQHSARSPSPPEFGSEEERKMLQRKRQRLNSPVICTSSPSIDHTYSITMETLERDVGSPGSSIDDEYDFGEDGYSRSDDEDDEEEYDDYNDDVKKIRSDVAGDSDETEDEFIAQGADALMHLARMKLTKCATTPVREGSPDSGAVQDSPHNGSPAKNDATTLDIANNNLSNEHNTS